ncbi:hypothetical protein OKA05_25860 [Luteolibacter arcticus]|uniref:Teneurin-like YD-shell domain-containing protein n=1 Tax=Luteolibacter arcticus TaxID=1581411 RepID=A0ABT3GR60_9BACT|nr:RHS repeat-associated core domain-containing protein [Luteolibacter arcticus]MCW1926011.1 hypothetical protein [Luteolibacter arcticus]
MKTVTDWAGRTVSQITPDPAGGAEIVTTTTYAPGTNRVVSISSSAPNVATLHTQRYYSTSDVTYQGYDLNSDGYLTYYIDRLTETKRTYEAEAGLWWEVSSQKTYDYSESAITTVSKRRLHGSAGGMASVAIQVSSGCEVLTTSVVFDRTATAKSRIETISRSTSNLSAVSTDLNGLTVSETSHVSLQPTSYGYDSLGRRISERTPAGAVTRTAYKTNGQVDTVTDPFGKVTSYAYHPPTQQAAGRVGTITKPDGKTVTYAYSTRGEVTQIGGTAEYRQDFAYNVYGEKVTLTTWRDGTNSSVTTWVYHPGTGLLLEKRYADTNKTTYTYHSSGKLASRVWARGVSASYSYNAYGDLTGIDYSDATPDVTMPSLDRLGRPLVITQDGIGSEDLSYHPAQGGLKSRSFQSGHSLLPGIGISYSNPRPDGSPAGFSETQASGPHTSQMAYSSYVYDDRGRMDYVYDGLSEVHRYGYNPLTSRIETVQWGYTEALFRQRRNHDVAGRLLAIHSDAISGSTATPLTRYGYELDNVGRRTKATLIDGSNWNYGYNDRSEVTSAVRKNATGTTIPALGATYQYDGIGNRTLSTSDVLGTRTYTPNGLNQYASITTTTTRTVTGRAPAADPVSVNGTALTAGNRTGDIFHFTLPSAANSSSPVWQPATIVSQGTTIDRAFYHPKADTTPMYDLDGNLVNDGRWVYSWDAENRLIQMESTTQAVTAGAPYRKLAFRYDAGGRRLSKTVYQGTASVPVFASSTRWIYDGWNPVSEFSATAETGGTVTRTKSYTWGLDLSGSIQGAGGVGGLLAVTLHNGYSNVSYCPSYDGNGNIVAWTLEGQTAPVSRREYDAFGNTMVEQGTAPSDHGFSTKMQDAETGLYYYGYRYYDAVTGKWVNRDPIEEEGGVNLFCFINNNGIDAVDGLGLIKHGCCLESITVTIKKPLQARGKGSQPFSVEVRYKKKGEIVTRESTGEEICCNPEACQFTQWVKGSLGQVQTAANGTETVGGIHPQFTNSQGTKVYPDVWVDDGYHNNTVWDDDKSIEVISYTDSPGMVPTDGKIWNLVLHFKWEVVDIPTNEIIDDQKAGSINFRGSKDSIVTVVAQ